MAACSLLSNSAFSKPISSPKHKSGLPSPCVLPMKKGFPKIGGLKLDTEFRGGPILPLNGNQVSRTAKPKPVVPMSQGRSHQNYRLPKYKQYTRPVHPVNRVPVRGKPVIGWKPNTYVPKPSSPRKTSFQPSPRKTSFQPSPRKTSFQPSPKKNSPLVNKQRVGFRKQKFLWTFLVGLVLVVDYHFLDLYVKKEKSRTQMKKLKRSLAKVAKKKEARAKN